MPFYSPVAVQNSGNPYRGFTLGYNGFYDYIKGKWMLTATECKIVGVPVQEGEEPDAYVYTVKGDGSNKYCGLYDRTIRFNRLVEAELTEYMLVPKEMKRLGIKR